MTGIGARVADVRRGLLLPKVTGALERGSGGGGLTGRLIALLPAAPLKTIGGGRQHKCGGACYRAAFQSSYLVYLVTQP